MVHGYAEKVIRDRKQSLGITGSNANSIEALKLEGCWDFLDILLTACDEDGTDVEIRNEVDIFLFGGHDKTASGITWTLYCSGVARGGPGGARPHLIVLVPRLTFKYEKFLILIA